MVEVTADMVRDRLNLTADDIGDEKVVEMIEDATATINLETGLSIDHTDCSEAEAAAIQKSGCDLSLLPFIGWLRGWFELQCGRPASRRPRQVAQCRHIVSGA